MLSCRRCRLRGVQFSRFFDISALSFCWVVLFDVSLFSLRMRFVIGNVSGSLLVIHLEGILIFDLSTLHCAKNALALLNTV